MMQSILKIVTIVGARPQFIKAAAVSRAIGRHNLQGSCSGISEILVHTGQHYDPNMSTIFFDELNMNAPHYHLRVGSGRHGEMTGRMLARIEEVLLEEIPDVVLLYGDTNSTIAGALSATKLNIPVAHVEAGLRSYNRRMPEEVNRVLTDHIANFLFCPTDTGVVNLKREGISRGVFLTGDVMLDAFLYYQKLARERSRVLLELDLKAKSYCLATIHRQENTEDHDRLFNIFKAFDAVCAEKLPLVIPLHPRTRKILNHSGNKMIPNSHIRLIEPVGYVDMIQLESNARIIFTDSGGVQKEAYFAGVPCVTLRDETEWVETVDAGVNFLAGADTNAAIEAYEKALTVDVKLKEGLYGNGHAAEKIVETLITNTQ
jgi:UDP-N-acetylglucosamine 2-epimerase